MGFCDWDHPFVFYDFLKKVDGIEWMREKGGGNILSSKKII
jgi:hypothetical protein